MGPAQRVDAVAVHQFAGCAVRFVGVPDDVSLISDNAGDEFRQLLDGQVRSGADVDKGLAVVLLHEEQTRFGEVVDVEELAAGRARAPAGHGRVAVHLRLVELADEGRNDVAVLQVIIVARTVQVGRHGRDEVGPVLVPVGLAQFDARNLGDGVGLVGRFERPGQQGVLDQGLVGEFRVDAARAEEQQLLDPDLMGGMDQVGLDHEVVIEEVRPVDVVGVDAPHLGRGDEDVGGPFAFHHGADGGLVPQVEFAACEGDGVGQSGGGEGPAEGAAHHAAVAGNVESGVGVHQDSVRLEACRARALDKALKASTRETMQAPGMRARWACPVRMAP